MSTPCDRLNVPDGVHNYYHGDGRDHALWPSMSTSMGMARGVAKAVALTVSMATTSQHGNSHDTMSVATSLPMALLVSWQW